MTAAIEAIMSDPAAVELIARTEIARAFSVGSLAVYEAAGIPDVRWLTSGDANVCPNCAANEAIGPVPLGTIFPSGASAPPQHPRCRCELIPA
jgi:SPP1 gp7 family putative phage head morphogenesis protein